MESAASGGDRATTDSERAEQQRVINGLRGVDVGPPVASHDDDDDELGAGDAEDAMSVVSSAASVASSRIAEALEATRQVIDRFQVLWLAHSGSLA